VTLWGLPYDGRQLLGGEDLDLVAVELLACAGLWRIRPSRFAVPSAARSGIVTLAMVRSPRALPCASSSASQSTKRASV